MDDWDDDFGSAPAVGGAADPLVDTEYARLQQKYTDAGYREGITDGKLATLQEGFDGSFAASVPRARRLGQLRGRVNALLAIASASSAPARTASGRGVRRSASAEPEEPAPAAAAPSAELIARARGLATTLASVRRDDVLPPDLERIAHEKEEHGDDPYDGVDVTPQREMEGLEGALAGLGGAAAVPRFDGRREDALLDALEAQVVELERALLA
ncbi:putative protein yae1 [Vanrija pseudolonga]|uniref:Protein YAE1 n=1 Tax=Vanrija pseudolonga TaxID=143232 RepID=A0AAF1BP02_9TREE|nr:purtative protein yae1 [Vanrija pseudolonga]